MLSPHTENRLRIIQASEKTYQPNSEIATLLRTKTLVMLIGPASVGKNFIIDALTRADPTFGFVPSFSTRDPRADDELGSMHLYPHNEATVTKLLDTIEAGEVVQYTIHPTTGRIYGTMPEDFSHQFALLPMLTSAVESIQQLPFDNTIAINLATSPSVWLERFNQRFARNTEERTRRLGEAVNSLTWSLAPERYDIVHWVDNISNDPQPAIQLITNIVKYDHQGDPKARKYAEQMLELAIREKEAAP